MYVLLYTYKCVMIIKSMSVRSYLRSTLNSFYISLVLLKLCEILIIRSISQYTCMLCSIKLQLCLLYMLDLCMFFFIVFDRYTNIQQHPVWVMWSNLSFIIARKLKYICYQLDNSFKCVLHVGLNSSRFGRLIFVSLVTW